MLCICDFCSNACGCRGQRVGDERTRALARDDITFVRQAVIYLRSRVARYTEHALRFAGRRQACARRQPAIANRGVQLTMQTVAGRARSFRCRLQFDLEKWFHAVVTIIRWFAEWPSNSFLMWPFRQEPRARIMSASEGRTIMNLSKYLVCCCLML